jgi:prepilin-type N-terminal cleavage/methylation domain-containing protein
MRGTAQRKTYVNIVRPATSPRPTRRGFTAAELSIAMLVVALVAAAAAALTLAVSQGWTQVERGSAAQVTVARTCLNVEQIMRGARMIGRWRDGTLSDCGSPTANVLVWREDMNGDGQVQFEEIAAIEFDGTKLRLVLYKAEFPNAATRAAANTTFASRDALNDSNALEEFKASNYTVAMPLTRDGEVTGAWFNVIAANNKGSKPCFEFALKFDVGGQTTMQYGTATLRSPV